MRVASVRRSGWWLLAALAATSIAHADEAASKADADAKPSTNLETIVVTATRTEQPEFDVPASIDAVTIGENESTLNVNLSEYLSTIPGVIARDRQNYAQDEQISIRGFGSRSTFGVRGVRLYTDGIPATQPDGQGQVSNFNLDSAERIEVLRGPFSALYGNSSGGVIQIFTADGSNPPELRSGVAAASYGVWRASANARGLDGPFGYNLDLLGFHTDGYREHSRAERISGNGKLTWQWGDGGKFTVIVNTIAIPGAQDPLGLTRAQFEADPRQATPQALQYNTRKSVHQNQGGAILEQDFAGGNNLRLLGYYGQRGVQQFLSIPWFAQENPLSSGGVVNLDSTYFGGDLRWTWKGNLAARPFEVAAGISYDRQNQHRLGYENFVGDVLGVLGALRRDEQDDVFNFDEYAQATWRFTDAWSLTAGVRHSSVRFSSLDHYITTDNPDDSGNVEYTATTPVAGLMFRASDWAHLYASYGQGFETPTFSELSYRADGGPGLAFNLLPSRSHNVEAGIKLQPTDRIRVNAALYRANSRDEIAVAAAANGRTTYQNIGKSRREGAEASLSAHLRDDLDLDFAYTLVNATFRSPFQSCGTSGCTTIPAGSRIPGVPKTDLYSSLRWRFAPDWSADINGNYVSSVPVDDGDTDSASPYFVLGIGADWTRDVAAGTWHCFARIDNALDRTYAGSVIVNDGNGRYFEPAPDRTFMVGVQWTWRH